MTRKTLFLMLTIAAQQAMATDPIDLSFTHEVVPAIVNSGLDFGNIDEVTYSNQFPPFTAIDQSCSECTGQRGGTRSLSAAPPRTQFVNSDFSQGITGWSASYTSTFFPIIPGSQTWVVANRGAPPPSGMPAATARPQNCAGRGHLWQDLRILPGTQLTFDWLPSDRTFANFGSDATTIGVTGYDPNTGRVLFSFNHPNRTERPGVWNTVIGMERLSGLDVRLAFSSTSTANEFDGSCRQFSWIDNVYLRQLPLPLLSGNLTPGLWYNRLRSGSGIDLRRAPNSNYYGVWYTYQAGQPIWYYLDEAPVVNGRFETTIRKYYRVGSQSRNETVGRAELRLAATNEAYWSFDFHDTSTPGQTWDKTEYLDLLKGASPETQTGMWALGDSQDPAWGIGSTLTGASEMFTTIYYYDGGGNPVWALAQGRFSNAQSAPVFRYTGGLCPNCQGTHPNLTVTDIGTVQISFNPANPNAMTAAVQLQGWSRPLRQYNRLSY